MALEHDLLAQARHLATVDKGKPKQANLRRAVSSAYYAVFHLLVSEGSATVGSRLNAAARAKVRRAFAHGDMKEVCKIYAKATGAANFKTPEIAQLLTFPIEAEVKDVSQAFHDLQEARHSADYDVSSKWSRLKALTFIIAAEDAFSNWQVAREFPNAKIFLFDLLLRKSWART